MLLKREELPESGYCWPFALFFSGSYGGWKNPSRSRSYHWSNATRQRLVARFIISLGVCRAPRWSEGCVPWWCSRQSCQWSLAPTTHEASPSYGHESPEHRSATVDETQDKRSIVIAIRCMQSIDFCAFQGLENLLQGWTREWKLKWLSSLTMRELVYLAQFPKIGEEF